jgi:hypothetical protein
MGIKEVQEAIAAEQAAQESQKGKQSETKQTQASEQNQSANEKRKKDATRKLQQLEILYSKYIGELASGKRKGETLSPRKLTESETAAVKLSDEIKGLNRIVNPPAPEKETRVGELPASRVPFGGQQVGGEVVSGPITGAVKTPTKTPTKTPAKTPTKKPEPTPEVRLTKEEILNRYPIIDALFDQDPELKALLNKYLDPKSKMTLDQFKKELGQAQYNFKYADVVKDRLAKKAIYDRLGASATGQSDYEREVARIAATMESTAIDLGAAVTKEDLNRLATNVYLAGTEANALVIERALTPFIKLGVSPVTGKPTIGGAAGSNYQALLNTAKANGIKEDTLARTLGFNSVEDVLRKLAEGEPINTFQQRLRDVAAYGRSDYVKNLLAQGTDFDVIISPYRNLMASVLEIANPEQISLDDPTLSMALGKEEMTLADFRRNLRKDPRWQYTDSAREDMSSTALNLLRNFGFQG